MKSIKNVIMSSTDRELFGVKIRQQTEGGLLNLSDLEEAYTRARINHGWPQKNITHILQSNTEVIFYLLEKQGLIKLQMRSFMEEVENQGFAKYMKTLGVYKTTGRGETKTVWVNPYIFVMVAMDLNPLFKAQVIGWLTDKLIINRIEAGVFYKGLSAALAKLDVSDYRSIAKALNWIVFNRHETGLRNQGNSKELDELQRIEEKLAFAIEMGYIKTHEELLNLMRKMWADKWNKGKIILPPNND